MSDVMDGRNAKRGQSALEYVLVFAALLGVLFALRHFARAAKASAERTAELVTGEYP